MKALPWPLETQYLICVQKYIKAMLVVILVAIASTWKQLICTSKAELIYKLYMHTRVFHGNKMMHYNYIFYF